MHFHLKDHIMIGKKKQKDVQFFTDVIDASVNLEGSKKYQNDADELMEEQRERELRKRLNLSFKDFSIKLQKVLSTLNFAQIFCVERFYDLFCFTKQLVVAFQTSNIL